MMVLCYLNLVAFCDGIRLMVIHLAHKSVYIPCGLYYKFSSLVRVVWTRSFFLGSCSVGVVGGVSSTILRFPSSSVAIMMLVQFRCYTTMGSPLKCCFVLRTCVAQHGTAISSCEYNLRLTAKVSGMAVNINVEFDTIR